MSDTVIELAGLRKSYGDVEVIKGIDLEVSAGEVFGFLGPNGAGKTTTIEILEGYRARSAGDVSVLGVDPERPTRAWRDRLGLVLQACDLEPLLTVSETLRLFSSFYSEPRAIADVIELVGLTSQAGTRLGRLSGGQRRRVDVAVALIGDPDLIFLDEPTTGFDPTARREAWATIAGLRELGKTVLLTTHYMEEAQHLADRVAVIRSGQIVAQGPPHSIGGQRRSGAVITFHRPEGVPVDVIASELGAGPDISGSLLSIEVEDAQRALHRLTCWADREQLQLQGLEVRRPSLEDVFLELTREEADA
jgi:ABC-2 type transport system ATP-binding protein